MPWPISNATDSYSGPLKEVRSVSTAGTGTAITTTSAFILLPGGYNGFNWLQLMPRNFATANLMQISLNPWLVVLKTQDNLATFTDYTAMANDSDTATIVTLSSMSTAAAQDYLYVGAEEPFAGVYIDVVLTNSTASALTVKYWNGTTWADITATDNTGGATSLANDGTVTWTVPAPGTSWVQAPLAGTLLPTPTAVDNTDAVLKTALYWVRFEWAAGLDASTTLATISAISRSVGMELASGQPFEEQVFRGIGGIGCIQAVVDSGVGGTGNLVVNVGVRPRLRGVALP